MHKVGAFTQAGTGQATIATGFQPNYLRFTISQLAGTPENNAAHISTGFTDGTQQYAHSVLSTATQGNYTRIHDTFCLSHHAIVDNTFKRVISASFVAFTFNGFTLDFDRASSLYLITFEAFS